MILGAYIQPRPAFCFEIIVLYDFKFSGMIRVVQVVECLDADVVEQIFMFS